MSNIQFFKLHNMSLEELIARRHGKVITKKLTLSQEVKKSIYWLFFTLLSIIVLLSIVFLLNTSQSNQKGYILQKEQVDKDKYELQKRELIDKIIQAESLKNIEQNAQVKKMQKPSNPLYLGPKGK